MKIYPTALLAIALLMIACTACDAAAPTTTSSGTPAATSAPTPTPRPLTWTTTHTYTGSGSKKTEVITVPDDWKILYSCSFQNIDGVTADGLLAVSVYNSDGSIADPAAVDATCKDGVAHTTGETEEHQAGRIYLSVNGTGDWSIQIQEMK